ncbi:BZ3500_MvSof-1268-A1-R1_Chr3-3g06596 [Microbotryum saponariae]|uniref:BZ3500_MvSof-1268-A1-R1_Chr3-3g06580 protein n=1 Tax=Microbotryum saponariae TaxID=289078 RepID=A0A2X0LYM2_9BASI|nr:BZ3500_MvSof-1268-A1-R1_Chr3-3g06580 [Microbotryum saponariae]SCZ98133.1 BZ3500_MvSof-1268-A1-R1_Chr3-3g06596 [Microbotryum saponariae]SDA04547.1 BZ3501_MvSof-1269-A2-R1_Chr3-2g06267 [Microbotryum saponariae]SDA04563.1 BZ3501_MvSof-1269-A2-R1_Chr3-2g06283 [Microbotryum saponariae]
MSYDPHEEGPGPQDLQILQVHGDRCADGRPNCQIVGSLHPSAVRCLSGTHYSSPRGKMASTPNIPLCGSTKLGRPSPEDRYDEHEDDEEEDEENDDGERKRLTVSSELFDIASSAAKPDPDEFPMSFDTIKDRWATLQLGRQLDHLLTFDGSHPASFLYAALALMSETSSKKINASEAYLQHFPGSPCVLRRKAGPLWLDDTASDSVIIVEVSDLSLEATVLTAKHRCRRPTRDHLKHTASAFPLSTSKFWTSSKAEIEAMVAFMEEKRKDNSLLKPPLPLPMSLVTLTPRSRLRPSPRSAHSPNRVKNSTTTSRNVLFLAWLSSTPLQKEGLVELTAWPAFTPVANHKTSTRSALLCIVCGSTSLDHPPTQLCHEFDPEAFTRSSSGALYHESSKPQVCFAFTR